MLPKRRIACWMSEKKLQKMKWSEFEEISSDYGLEIFKIDLGRSLDEQGPFDVFLHKLTDIIALANEGDQQSLKIMQLVETYLSTHPEVIVIDPIPNVRQLLDRFWSYSIIHATDLHKYGVFTPNFCEITSDSVKKTAEELKAAQVSYPFICKPSVGHGSKKAHEMLIVFSKDSLEDCNSPCVAQTFVNHNAVLYKLFVVGDRYYFVERPSLKNFYAGQRRSIFFDSADISKANSQSSLSVLDDEEEEMPRVEPTSFIFDKIASTLRKAFGMDLLGIDVVIENYTEKYAIVDVNAYPGYDGFPHFFHHLFKCIDKKISFAKQNNDDEIVCLNNIIRT